MSDTTSGRRGSLARNDSPRPTWQRRVTTAVIIVVLFVVVWLIGAAIIPRWWASRVRNVVEGSMTTGVMFGVFIGFVFTALPLVALWIGIRSRGAQRTWKGWVTWLVVAALAALPNLMTLGIVLGRGNSAETGRRILSDDAAGFKLGSLIGAIAAAVGLAVLGVFVRSRRGDRGDARGRNRGRRRGGRSGDRRDAPGDEIADRQPAS